VKLKLIPDNPALHVDAPSYRRQEIRPLSLEQAHTLLAAVKGTRLEALWTVAVACGVRPGEALGLRWSDVDWTKGTITVRQQLQRDLDGKLKLGDLKTAKARRVIFLPAVVIDALRQHHTHQLEERARSWEWEKNDLIFCTEGAKAGSVGGKPLIHRNVYHLLQTTLKAAGLPPQRLYDLRHLCASLLLAQGASMREIMEILGHSQMSMTSDTYTHVYNEQGKANAERMNKFLQTVYNG
jgi:integrase